MSILQELYDSEINATIGWVWDGGFDLNLGDGMNSFVSKGYALNWAEAEDWLEHEAIQHYPDSVFAQARTVPALGGDPEKLAADVRNIIAGAKPAAE